MAPALWVEPITNAHEYKKKCAANRLSVGASLLAMVVNGNALNQTSRRALGFFASKLAQISFTWLCHTITLT